MEFNNFFKLIAVQLWCNLRAFPNTNKLRRGLQNIAYEYEILKRVNWITDYYNRANTVTEM